MALVIVEASTAEHYFVTIRYPDKSWHLQLQWKDFVPLNKCCSTSPLPSEWQDNNTPASAKNAAATLKSFLERVIESTKSDAKSAKHFMKWLENRGIQKKHESFAFTSLVEDDDLRLERIAREILQIDEKGASLRDKYLKILETGLQPLPSNARGKDVIIVGAGMAGLLCASLLKGAGFNVTVLEAHENRVGGRVFTFHKDVLGKAPFKDPELYGEAGAMRIPTTHPLVNRLIDVMGLKKQDFYNVDVSKADPSKETLRTWLYTNGVKMRRTEYNSTGYKSYNPMGFPVPEKFLDKTAAKLLETALDAPNDMIRGTNNVEGWKTLLRKYDHYSVYKFLKESYPDQVVDYIGTLQNLTSRLFLSFIHTFVDNFYLSSEGKFIELEDGNWKLPYAFIKEKSAYDKLPVLGENIIMDSKVVEIQWSDPRKQNNPPKAVHRGEAGVYVRTVNSPVTEAGEIRPVIEREFTANYLVLAIPFSALRMVKTEPLFSYDKHRSIIEMHYDSATKVLLEFSERFWEWDKPTWESKLADPYAGHNSIGGGSITDLPNRFIYFPSHSNSRGGVILASYTWADDANRWDSMKEVDRYSQALEGLTTIYGKGIKKYFTGYGKTQSWMNDPYCYGEAAVFSPGQLTKIHPYVGIPEGVVHFAGEHTSLKHAWIEGALESAIRVALEIRSKIPVGADDESFSSAALSAFSSVPKSVPKTDTVTVANYLKHRLEQLGVKHLFTVAGNYVAPFLDTILSDKKSPISITGVPNELCAGYASDGYARLNGLCAVAVTYGVGAFHLLNGVTGASVEKVPIVIINGGLTNKEILNQQFGGAIYSHTTKDPQSNLHVYQNVTAAAVRITSNSEAPYAIDSALTTCITAQEPVYIEISEDIWRSECMPPRGILEPYNTSIGRNETDDAVDATWKLINAFGNPVVWAGVEIQRQKLQKDFLKFLETTQFYFTTTSLGKSIVTEEHAKFLGVYGPSSPKEINAVLKNSGCWIGIGAWTTGKDTHNKLVHDDRVVLAAHGGVYVGAKYFPKVPLKDFLQKMQERVPAEKVKLYNIPFQRPTLHSDVSNGSGSSLTYDLFFSVLNDWLQKNKDTVIVSDASFPLVGALNLHIPQANGFVAQASWLSIGYSVPAAVGVKFAQPEKRVVVVIGDGAFQETCQAFSLFQKLKQNTVVFVLNNGIYGIEQQLVNPNPFRPKPVEYKDPILNNVYSYNELPDWKYEKLAEVFGGIGNSAQTKSDLDLRLKDIDDNKNSAFIINIKLPKLDMPKGARDGVQNVGEDEVEHPNWPPKHLF